MREREQEQKQFNAMVLVPKQLLEKVHQTQERILLALEELPTAKPVLTGMVGGKYIPETTAKEMLGKGTTWFWQMRKSGKLSYKKVGSKIYYVIEDIENLIEGGGQNND